MAKKKYIESPEKMWELFKCYKSSIDSNKDWEKFQYVGRDGDRVSDPLKVPYTMEGFENYVANIDGMPQSLERYFANSNDDYNEFLTICSRIRREIRENQITGGLLGFYNPSITQRLNGLTDKKETTVKGGINIPELPDIGNRK